MLAVLSSVPESGSRSEIFDDIFA